MEVKEEERRERGNQACEVKRKWEKEEVEDKFNRRRIRGRRNERKVDKNRKKIKRKIGK